MVLEYLLAPEALTLVIPLVLDFLPPEADFLGLLDLLDTLVSSLEGQCAFIIEVTVVSFGFCSSLTSLLLVITGSFRTPSDF